MTLKARSRRRFEVYGRLIETAGDNLHRFIASQCTDTYRPGAEVAVLLRKQPSMPVQQAIQRQRLGKMLSSIKHQLRKTFTALADSIAINQIQTQASSQRRTNGADVQLFTFNGR
ncbi:hypothetical protein D3C86_1448320 [compost metagenome]